MVTRPCDRCGAEVRCEPCMLFGREVRVPVICEDCEREMRAEAERRRQAMEQAEREARWAEICPPLYRDTDARRVDYRLWSAVQLWEWGPVGLGLVGPSGVGKTRCAYALLRRVYDSGRSVAAVPASKFALICAEQYDRCPDTQEAAKRALRGHKRTQCLLLDDILKPKYTERVEIELFDLLEHRTAHMLPTIWTANARGEQFAAMLSPERAEPIIRRLAEFSRVVAI